MSAPRPNAVSGGFTVVEVLVVLVIVGVVSTILMEGMSRFYMMRARMSARIGEAQQELLAAEWFRRSVVTLVPDPSPSPLRFKGGKARLAGLTLAVPDGAEGVPHPIEWRVEVEGERGRGRLAYRSGKEPVQTVLEWSGRGGRFFYADRKGQWHDQWPPALGQWPELPDAVRLDLDRTEGRLTVFARVRADGRGDSAEGPAAPVAVAPSAETGGAP